MKLQCSLLLNEHRPAESALADCPRQSAVFAIHFDEDSGKTAPPYLGRTSDLHRRLARLLGNPRPGSRLLNLRQQARRVEYSCVGSGLEALWLLYLLNKAYYPRAYRQRLRLKSPALLKLNIGNRYPRLYPTRRLSRDGAVYYGPFASRATAERFASEFLDFFKIRRCVEDLRPDPAHPGCIYSQMKMCLAPCFQGCTDEEYAAEVSRVAEFLNGAGRPLVRELENERAQASEALDFERAARVHNKIEKVNEVLRLKPTVARNLRELHAVLVLPGADAGSVVFFRVVAGELRGPVALCVAENRPMPLSLDEQIRTLLESLEPPGVSADSAPPLPPWEHLSLLARWYYSSFRSGEIAMLDSAGAGAPNRPLPTRALIRACRKVLAPKST
jgi:excinuclease ABC subunit C